MKRERRSRAQARRVLLRLACACALWIALLCGWRSWRALPQVQIPTPKLPQPNAFDVYMRASKAFVGPTPSFSSYEKSGSYNRDPVPLAAKERWLKDNVHARRLLREGFRYRYLQPTLPVTHDPRLQLSRFRDLARLLVAESQVRAARGDEKEAVNSALDVIHLGTDVPYGAPLVGALSGQATERMGREELWNLLPHLDAATARTTAKRLEQLAARRISMAQVLRQTKWDMQRTLLYVMRKRLWKEAMWDTGAPNWQLIFINNRLVMRHHDEIMDIQIANAQKPYAAPHQPFPEVARTWADPFTATHYPRFERAPGLILRGSADHNLLLTALALRAYRLQKGHYPAQLSALVPAYLSKIPDDPYALHQPLRYKLAPVRYIREVTTDHSDPMKIPPGAPDLYAKTILHYAQIEYCLYSVGLDSKDDGGQPLHDEDSPSPNLREYYRVQWDRKGDIIAGINH